MRRRAEIRVLSVLMVLGAGCASNTGRSQTSAKSPLEEAVRGLCQAEALAREGDIAGARDAFLNRSHTYLHELAADVTERDPATAAMLLEAKQQVEANLDNATDGGRLAALVAELLDAVDAAARAAGLGKTRCMVGVR